MVAIGAVLVLVLSSMIVTRIGSAALTATGVSADLAYFQARSAFTGVGYTTREAEAVTDHPVRRRIILILMLLGNAGVVSVIASLVLGFSGADSGQTAWRFGVLVLGLALLWAAASTAVVNRLISRLIDRALDRWTDLEVRDYVQLLDVHGEYAVRDLLVHEGDWLTNASLRDLGLRDEGVLVLSIRRDNGEFIGAPTADTEIRPKDTVVLYGREETLAELDVRQKDSDGHQEHHESVQRQQDIEREEQARDEAAEQRAA